MAKATVVERHLQAGSRYLKLLSGAGIEVRAAMWLYSADVESWALLLALDGVKQHGRLPFYDKVLRVYRQHEDELRPIRFDDIVVKDVKERPFDLINGVVHSNDIDHPLHFGENVIDGVVIDDAYIYATA